ncbi:transcriptional regulatory [Lecanosticta acicola]|uniref:Transcriptional regulatory n=1 Tax=Lecanosticta acicola TaxID=111012 RepID=A0AAI9EB32_9PEZI|nr:transcriptional regulatory [Lecanosticta acicola]
MSEYKRNSPSANLVNLDFMGPASAYGGSQSGTSDYDFDLAQAFGPTVTGSANSGTYTAAPTSTPSHAHPFAGFENGVLPSPSAAPPTALSDAQSPITAHHHRASIGSNAPMARHNSFGGGSDMTSPGNKPRIDHNDASQPAGDGGKAEDAAHAPSWSELKTKAGKERKRLPLACIACRRKKIRCSGEKPACKHCLRSRIPCVYKVTTRKAAPRTDYMAMLDKRLKRMEDRVIKIIPKEEQGIVASTGRAVVKPSLPAAPPKPTASSKKRAAEVAFGDELEEWASDKNKPPAAASKEGPVTDEDSEKARAKDPEEQNLLREGTDKLPSKEIQEHLSEVFFDYVYGQSYHLLHKPSFMRRLAQGTVPPVLMLAVCAISARFSNHPSVRTEPAFLRGESWSIAAREIALRRFDTPNITILIVYLILGLHEFGTCQGGRSWMFGGMAQRMAYALQLHKDLDHDPKDRARSELTFTDREIRRRTMWSCFLMDRFNSSGTDRPIFVGEQYIRAQLPIKESYFQMEINGPTQDLEGAVPNPVDPGQGQMADAKENMGVAAYLIRLVSIWGRLINYLNQGGKERDEHHMWSEGSNFQSIKNAVEGWKKTLPSSLEYSSENLQYHASEKIANQFIFLHLVHNQIILFMNRFALPSAGGRPQLPKDMPEDFIAEAARTALEAANQISALIHEANDHLVVAPFAGYCAFFSSTVHIHGVFSKNAALEASSKQNLAWNVKYLTKMKKYWGMFHFVTENLRDLYRRHADAARSGAKSAGKEGEQAIFQYGDWFDRYPHGVSGTDYEEPSTEMKKEPGSDAVLGQKSDLQTVEEFFSKLSPPSRAAHMLQQQQQPSTSRKVARKKHSKSVSEGSKTGQNASNAQQSSAGNSHQQAPSQQVTHDLASTQGFQHNGNMGDFSQQASSFSPGFQQQQNPLAMNSLQFLSQMDRQMVLNSYANSNQNAQSNLNTLNMLLENTGNNLGDFDWSALANSNGQNGQGNGFWGDPSTAWFMPFNLDPPTIGEDNNLFSGSFDWSNGFPGFGDVSGMPSTGLTPGMEVDGGQDSGMTGDQPGSGLDGLDQM